MTPNFLIVGAMRAGTSALYHYLVQHPEIFMCARKELRFFAYGDGRPNFRGPGDDQVNRNWIATWDEYCRNFVGVGEETAIGEASPFYLCSEEAAERIKARLPEAKLIIVLREPSSRAYSSFQFLRQAGREPLADFRAALAAEEERKRDNWEFLWRYRTAGLYGRQVKRYLDLFPKKNIWIGIYDDFVNDPMSYIQSIFRFLETDDTFRPDIKSRPNVSGIPKRTGLHRAMTTNNIWLSLARKLVPKAYRQPIRTILTLKNLDRVTIPPDVERELKDFYKPDIERLERLIERDLSAWKG